MENRGFCVQSESKSAQRNHRRQNSKENQLGVEHARPSSRSPRSPRCTRAQVEPLPQGYQPNVHSSGTSRSQPVQQGAEDEEYDSNKEYEEVGGTQALIVLMYSTFYVYL